jgi:hypothetical protein
LLDRYSDVSSRRSLCCPLSYAQGRLAQLIQHMGCVETTNAVLLQHASNGRLAHTGGLLRCRRRLPQIEDPIVGQVVGELQHLGIVAPKLIPQPIGVAATFYLEFFVDARPFSELDNERLGNREFAETAACRS